MTSEIAAASFFALGLLEHFRDRAVSGFVFVCLAVPLCWIGAYVAWKKKYDEVIELRRKEREVPQIKQKEFLCDKRTAERREQTTGELIDSWFIYSLVVRFRNEPEHRVPSAIARDVIAHLEFFRLDHGALIPIVAFDGRWAGNQQIAHLSPTQTVKDILATDIRIGETVELDITARREDEDDCYAVSNQPSDRHKLGVGEFLVKVCLEGVGVNRTYFQLKFENRGKWDYLRPIA